MAKREDVNETAFRVVQQSLGLLPPTPPPPPDTPQTVRARKGGTARASALTARKRKAIAQKAALARWGK